MAETSTRHNYMLKNGIGTVAVEDYDKAKHGPVVEETDEQYELRIHGRPKGVPGPPTTTIVGLQTFEAEDLPKPPAPVVPIFTLGPAAVGQKVATVGDVTGESAAAKQRKAADAKAFDSKR